MFQEPHRLLEPELNERLGRVVGEGGGEAGRTREQRATVGVVLLLPVLCYPPVRG